MDTTNTTAAPAATQPEALRLAAWLNEGAWHRMTLGDVNAAARELRRLHALTTAPAAQEAEPLYWVRIGSDGDHYGPLPHASMGDVRKRSGAWTPLYTHPPRPQEDVGAVPAAAPTQEAAPLTYSELLEIRRAMDDFEDCGETDVDYRLLLRAALAGYLECTRFQPLNQSLLDLETAIEAARARQEGAQHER